jgi:drug/metabolite transporter (DMT)-like permease
VEPRARATLLGFGAVLSWAFLALLTVWSGDTPPFQLAALCFAIGGLVGFADMIRRGAAFGRAWTQPPLVWALGVGGIFGYHFFYFTALRNAPPAQAGLIAYLWPLLIVLLAGLLPGERLRAAHLVGAAAAFGGVALLIGPDVGALSASHAVGYAAAGLCALTWSSYSVLSRRVSATPTDAVAAFCLVAAILAGLCHLALETTVWPRDAGEWAAVLGLGLGPVGGAFYLWDAGVKRGDIQLLGVAAYLAPLLSTCALIAAGFAAPTPMLLAAALMIAGGAALAAIGSRRASPRG